MTGGRDEFDRWLEGEAPKLHEEWDSPQLWQRIETSLTAERQQRRVRPKIWWPVGIAAMLALLTIPSALMVWKARARNPELLTEQTMREVQIAEAAYSKSIEKLTRIVGPQLENPSTPLLSSYREKLMLLDSAVDVLKAEAERNPYNHHIRRELLALYQDKQRTLEGIINEKQNQSRAN